MQECPALAFGAERAQDADLRGPELARVAEDSHDERAHAATPETVRAADRMNPDAADGDPALERIPAEGQLTLRVRQAPIPELDVEAFVQVAQRQLAPHESLS